MAEPLQLWRIYVPTIMRGKPVRLRHHRQWDHFVRRITGGLTIYKPAIGQWVDPATATLHVERSIPVELGCTRRQFKHIVAFTLEHYDQIAVAWAKLGDEFGITNRKDEVK